MDQKDRVFTPAFVANLFLIAGTVFLLLKGKNKRICRSRWLKA